MLTKREWTMGNQDIKHHNRYQQFTPESTVPPAPKSVPKMTKDIKVIEISRPKLNRVSELICLKCLRRWTGAYPEYSSLKDINKMSMWSNWICYQNRTGYLR